MNVLLTLLGAILVTSPIAFSQSSDSCITNKDCASCIRARPTSATNRCAWCAKKGFGDNRCQSTSVIQDDSTWCNGDSGPNPDFVENPASNLTIDLNNPFDSSTQLRPQKVTVDMRLGDVQELSVSAQRAGNFPMDLYYLMDVSDTMKDDLERLKALASSIGVTASSLTNDIQLGFGTFVDKPVLPFTDTSEGKRQNPCLNFNRTCPPTFSFQNSLPLTNNQSAFVDGINQESTSANLDLPEGMLDALMQVVVCGDQAILWRSNALHLVVVTTDGQFHVSGDGLFAGIYEPNDGLCHTKPGLKGTYDKATEQDYPSISQMKQVLFNNQINPIFAVTLDYRPLYEKLVAALAPEVLALHSTLTNDSSNILDLIRDSYEQISSQVSLTVSTKGSSAIESKVTVESCANDPVKRDTNRDGCKDIRFGQRANFSVSLKLTECTDNTPFTILLDAAAFGRTEVTINPLCDCDCKSEKVDNSPDCSSVGTLQCGQCICDATRGGADCSVICESAGSAACSCSNSTDICSGNGECECGKCKCFLNEDGGEQYAGDCCQCTRVRCRNAQNGQECGGPNQGVCTCTPNEDNPQCSCECECRNNFKSQGEFLACDCSPSKDNCMVDSEDTECYSHGTCECNRCNCTVDFDDGGLCRTCQTEACTNRCTLPNLENCVRACLTSGASTICPGDDPNCAAFRISIPPNGTSDLPSTCLGKDASNCDYEYAVSTSQSGIRVVHILNNGRTECPVGVNLVPIVLGIVFGILAIGVALLLIWWLLARLAAYREFKAFEKDRANAFWTQTTSPLYEPPTKKYQNPTYRKKQA
eukprot:m.306789 g.306789  ORF g.306789 m.306789 type:complete len:815 (+) comp41587_c0_seq1:178-2622(+)